MKPNQLKAHKAVADYARVFTVPALIQAVFLLHFCSVTRGLLLHHNTDVMEINDSCSAKADVSDCEANSFYIKGRKIIQFLIIIRNQFSTDINNGILFK